MVEAQLVYSAAGGGEGEKERGNGRRRKRGGAAGVGRDNSADVRLVEEVELLHHLGPERHPFAIPGPSYGRSMPDLFHPRAWKHGGSGHKTTQVGRGGGGRVSSADGTAIPAAAEKFPELRALPMRSRSLHTGRAHGIHISAAIETDPARGAGNPPPLEKAPKARPSGHRGFLHEHGAAVTSSDEDTEWEDMTGTA
jgi:hypothetical protein|eukprot:Tamp_19011.p1 GENE.Tamp_19011~~Tamp_19011.p1  ORF type:complete len:222 (-),score=18.07 Tamp_19011:620-1207(-)